MALGLAGKTVAEDGGDRRLESDRATRSWTKRCVSRRPKFFLSSLLGLIGRFEWRGESACELRLPLGRVISGA